MLAIEALREGMVNHRKSKLHGGCYLSTGDLERRDVSLADLDVLDPRPNLIDNTTKLVAQNITFGKLNDSPVK